jgi:large subunit ribosomal protein L2
MGKPIIAQKRGKGNPAYTTKSHKFRGEAKHYKDGEAIVIDLLPCPLHSAPLALVEHEDGLYYFTIAGEGCSVGDSVQVGKGAELKVGNTLALTDLPEGTPVFNIESQPNDGGKFCRSSGTTARIVSKTEKIVTVQLPSKKQRSFNAQCRATIGIVAGGGRTEKPLLKAGNAYHKHKARNKYWPRVSPNSMAAHDHPFGNTRSLRKSKSKPAPRNAPPGRKVGHIRPRRTGKR